MLPAEYGSGSTCHGRFQEWIKLDFFRKIRIRLLKTYDNLIGVKWAWQSLDGIPIKLPLGRAMAEGSNLTDRGKLGTKRHALTDKEGIPPSVVMSSESMPDVKLVTDVEDNAVAKRHISSLKTKTGIKRKLQHLCPGKEYSSKPEGQAIAKRGYAIHLPHKRKRGEVKKDMEK